ncbi:MAG: thioredoxin domain-containing protein [Gemmatimonadetes bacterium]|nr:thioredoxin domain-containing protein [Gemmatimonadota bacterium]NIR81127.1 thioredoxin domain-containing protein [Gemmatimonadota bacterium]NIT89951.1 thioredoxin domain-containing protein [Gemmatimonadota bacterium]NIU33752.1 thioredoxin domain-containing protein [Gemmatimonadota bacterium]NIU37983.1 thioredoxin domain-containing protein [Gemmatimonadota bacterium]
MAKSERGERQSGEKAGGGSGMTRLYYILGAVGVLGIGILGYSVGSSAMGSAATEPVELQVDGDRELVEIAEGMVQGNPDAPVSIVEFGDYQCPGCGSFARQVKPMINLNYIQAGQANFVFYDFPLTQIHSNAFFAARAARCAGDQEAYWPYHDALFANQADWASSGSPAGKYVDYAEELGLDTDAFESCLKSDRHAATVTANMLLGERLGVNGTPTVMISEGRGMANRLARFDFATIRSEVERILAQDDDEASGSDTGGRD